jgi:hypothetical protein
MVSLAGTVVIHRFSNAFLPCLVVFGCPRHSCLISNHPHLHLLVQVHPSPIRVDMSSNVRSL